MTEKDAVKCAAFADDALLVPAACGATIDPALVARWSRRSSVDPKLLEILVCPVTKGPLDLRPREAGADLQAARLAYPIRDGIPVMLEDEARKLEPSEYE